MEKNSMEILRKERANLVESIRKKKLPFYIIIKQLIVLFLMEFGLLIPLKIDSDNQKLAVGIVISIVIVLILENLIIFYFSEKVKNKYLYIIDFIIIITYSLFINLIITNMKLKSKEVFICFLVLILLTIIQSSIIFRIKAMLLPTIFMICIEIFLGYKFLNIINPFLLVLVGNALSCSINMRNIYENLISYEYKNKKNDIILYQLVVYLTFVAEFCCIANLV